MKKAGKKKKAAPVLPPISPATPNAAEQAAPQKNADPTPKVRIGSASKNKVLPSIKSPTTEDPLKGDELFIQENLGLTENEPLLMNNSNDLNASFESMASALPQEALTERLQLDLSVEAKAPPPAPPPPKLKARKAVEKRPKARSLPAKQLVSETNPYLNSEAQAERDFEVSLTEVRDESDDFAGNAVETPVPSETEQLVTLKAWGYEDPYRKGCIQLGDNKLVELNDGTGGARGLYIAAVAPNPNGTPSTDIRNFDTWKSTVESDALIAFLETLPLGTYIFGASADDISKNLNHVARRTLSKTYGIHVSQLGYRFSLAFVAKKGDRDWTKQKIGERNKGPITLKTVVEVGGNSSGAVGIPPKAGLPFSNLDLVNAKKRLKDMNPSKKAPVALTRDVLFDVHKQFNQFPLEKIRDMFTASTRFTKLDLTGVAQLTDVFFHMVQLTHGSSLVIRKVTDINLQGCYHITDQGVTWLAGIFPKLTNLILNGCRRVTERSLVTLLDSCPELITVSMKGCDVGVMPPHDQTKPTMSVKLHGCPLLQPHAQVWPEDRKVLSNFSLLCDVAKNTPYQTIKAVVVKEAGAGFSLGDILTGAPLDKERREFSAHSGYKLTEDVTLNIVECTMPYFSLVSSERAVYVLLYNASERYQKSLAESILYIKSKVDSAVFVIAGIGTSNSVKLSQQDVKDALTKSFQEAGEACHTAASNINQSLYIKQQMMGFSEQLSAGHLFHMKDALLELEEQGSIFFTNEPLNLHNYVGVDALKNTLNAAVRQIHKTHPMYRSMSDELVALVTTVVPEPGVHDEHTLVTKLRKVHKATFGKSRLMYRKALQLMHKFGLVLYIPEATGSQEGLVITDVGWFASVVHQLTKAKQAAKNISDDILTVKDSTVALDRMKVRQILMDNMSADKVPQFRKLLSNLGLFHEEPNSGHLVMVEDIPAEPPMPMSHYTDSGPGVCSITQSVHFPFGLPSSLWPVLLQYTTAISPDSVCVVWREGIILQLSPVLLCVCFERTELGPSLEIMCQTGFPAVLPMEDEGIKPILEGFEKSTAPLLGSVLASALVHVEYCLKQWGIFYTLLEPSGVNITDLKQDLWCGVTSGHQFKRKTFEEQWTCKHCGSETAPTNLTWTQHKALAPGFSSVIPLDNEDITIKGSWVSTTSDMCAVTSILNLDPADFCQMSVTVLTMGKHSDLSISLRNEMGESGRELLTMEVKADHIMVYEWKKVMQAKKKENADDEDDDDDDTSYTDSEGAYLSEASTESMDILRNLTKRKKKRGKKLNQDELGADLAANMLGGMFGGGGANMLTQMAAGMTQGLVQGLQGVAGGLEGMDQEGMTELTKQLQAMQEAGQNGLAKDKVMEGAPETPSPGPEEPVEYEEVWRHCGRRVEGATVGEGDTVVVTVRFLDKCDRGAVPHLMEMEDGTQTDSEETPTKTWDAKDLLVEYSFELIGGIVLGKAIGSLDHSWRPIIKTNKMTTLMVDNSYGQSTSEIPTTWMKGMRLEAKDKKTPSLICVASITDMRGDNEVLIHFDGWTSTYDYWTTTDDPELHPVGFMKYNSQSLPSGANKQLQAPKGHVGTFEWPSYLVSIKSYPVPHHLFSESQKHKTQPFILDQNTLSQLQNNSQSFSANKACASNKIKPQGLTNHLTREFKHSESNKLIKDFPFTVLPSDMDKQFILYPALKDMWMSRKDLIYLICTHYDGQMHLMDTEGLAPPSNRYDEVHSAVLHYMMKVATMIHLCGFTITGDIVPDNVKHLVIGVKDWDHAKLERKLVKLFKQYFTLLVYIADADFFKYDIQKLVDPKLAKDFPSTMKTMLQAHKPFADAMRDDSTPMCSAHRQCDQSENRLTSVPLKTFQDHCHLIAELKLTDNSISLLPDDFFADFPNLMMFQISNNVLQSLPLGLHKCRKLKTLFLKQNKLRGLPPDFSILRGSLMVLDISHNEFINLPTVVFDCVLLEELQANHIILEELSPNIGGLDKLRVLGLGGNALDHLPAEIGDLETLEELNLSGVRFVETHDRSTILSRQGLNTFVESYPIMLGQTKQLAELFTKCDSNGQGTLDAAGIQAFNAQLYQMFPRLQSEQGKKMGIAEPHGCCPPVIFRLKKLRHLDLSYQGLTRVTAHFKDFQVLEELLLSYNPQLDALAGELSELKYLRAMPLRGCPSLKTPPKEIVARGFKAVYGYLKRINMGSVECKRTKLMMVGLGGAGKTSLVQALKSSKGSKGAKLTYSNNSYMRQYGTPATEGITDGIDITDWTVSDVTFSVWDFAGQTVYYNTHQFFMSNRAVYLLLWNIRLGYEHAGLDFWLSSIACHAPKAPILIIGTHSDQVEKFWLPSEELSSRYPQIKGFYAISCQTKKGVEELASEIVTVALKEKYMGERIPEAWLNLEKRMLEYKKPATQRPLHASISIHDKGKKRDSLTWEEVTTCAEESGIVELNEVSEAVQFLHELGAVQHFRNIYLRNRVVINPQWIVDAMACVVSVHDTPIVDGKLDHADVSKVWTKFEEELHSWLLRLTEEFDLTFPLKNQPANLVPCLLPPEEPKFNWPDVTTVLGSKETKMLYKFTYLPAGLFNRAQVRLYQFSDSSIIWKKGSLLHKNGHMALLKQRENNVHLKVQGPRPANFVFMVHEVFEGLMAESFHGVTYDYFVPCTDCVKAFSLDPSLFPASRIRRATEMKAPFLQCEKLFHTLSLHELHSQMPPDNSTDYDIHLERSLRDLDDLRDDLTHDVFMLYTGDDVPAPGEDDRKVAPRRIMKDLENNGFKVWFPADPKQIDLQRETLTIRQAKLVVVCISPNFVACPDGSRMFYYVKQNLQKHIQLVCVGNSLDWKKSEIGMHCATDVFVNMTDPKRYEHKIKELVGAVKDVVVHKKMAQMQTLEHPECFISYCWTNSADAIKKGSRPKDGSVGYGDPRAFKDYLETRGISCWVDIENAGKGSLFEEIAQGLRQAKVMVVCVSDEYCQSRNCQVEFRFAAITLKIPMVIAVVGTGQEWESTEVGMLSLGFPKVNLQYEVPGSMDRLMEAVKAQLPKDGEEGNRTGVVSNTPSSATPSDNNQLAFQELLELAQRKFLRQVGIYADEMESAPYPRLLLLDYLTDTERDQYVAEVRRKRKEEEEAAKAEAEEAAAKEEAAAEAERAKATEGAEEKEGTEEKRETEEAETKETTERTESRASEAPKERPSTAKSIVKEDAQRPSSKESQVEDLPGFMQRPGSSASETRPGSSLRPLSEAPRKLLKRRTTSTLAAPPQDVLEELMEEMDAPEFCVRLLCEHDQGWHETAPYYIIPALSATEQDEFLEGLAPYMARLYAILKHSNISLSVLDLDKGNHLRKRLIDKCGLESEFKTEYVNWRKVVMEMDSEKKLGDLARCQLPSGKTLWLCEEHRKGDRITVLSSDDAELDTSKEAFGLDFFNQQDVELMPNPSEKSENEEKSEPSSTPKPERTAPLRTETPEAKARPPQSKPVPKRRASKLNRRQTNTTAQAQQALADIMAQGLKQEGSQACVVM